MENPKNIWFQSNKARIEKLKRELIEYSYAGSYGGSLDLVEIARIIDGALIEIVKLEKEINSKDTKIRELTKKENEK
jgi:hypothetical protein